MQSVKVITNAHSYILGTILKMEPTSMHNKPTGTEVVDVLLAYCILPHPSTGVSDQSLDCTSPSQTLSVQPFGYTNLPQAHVQSIHCMATNSCVPQSVHPSSSRIPGT